MKSTQMAFNQMKSTRSASWSSVSSAMLVAALAACSATSSGNEERYVPGGSPIGLDEPASSGAGAADEPERAEGTDADEGAARAQVAEAAWPHGTTERLVHAGAMRPAGGDPFALSIWSQPGFKRWILESYAAETEIEPGLTSAERDQLARVLDLLAADKLDGALAALEKARGPSASAVFDFTLANIRFQQEDFDAARDALEIAVTKHPRFRRAWQNLGVIHFRDGDFQRAIPALTKVIELGGANAITYGMLGFAYTSVLNYLSAETAYRLAVLMDAETSDWKQGLSFCLFKQGRYAETAALCDAMILADQERTDLWMLQANAFLGLEQPLKAAENYELVDRLGGSTAASLDKLGDIYVSEELYELALGAYIRAFEKDPAGGVERAVRAARLLASRDALDETGELIASIEAARVAPLEPEAKKHVLRLQARIAVAQGAGDEEARILREIVELDPLDGQALILLARHHEREGDPEQAIFYYERALNLERFESDANVGLAQLLVRQGKYKEALPLLRRANTLAPRENVREFIEQVERYASAR